MKPFPHQIEASSYLQANNGGFLYIEQRGGKTKPTVDRLMKSPFSDILIITKSTSLVVWFNELRLQGVPENQIMVLSGGKKKRERGLAESDIPFVIANWDMVERYKLVDFRKWEAIVFDESSCMANGTASVTRYILRSLRRLRACSDRQPFITALSGKPAPESPIQYAAQAMAVQGEYFGYKRLDEYIYEMWKENPKKPGSINKMIPRSPLHLAEIKGWVQKNCFVRTMDQLGLGSERLYSRMYVDLNKEQKKAISWALAKKSQLGAEIGDKVFVGYMNQIAAGINPESGVMINVDKIKLLLEKFAEDQEPMVVFSFFKAPLREASRIFGVCSRVITGDNTKSHVDEVIEDFQNGGFKVLFAQTDLVKMGRDLSRADVTYYLNNSFSSDTRDQSEMRTTRIDKNTPVGIVDICTRDTMDESIVNMLVKKDKISDSFLVKEMKKMEATIG
jgi:superfamily II DNA or RNA helicase